MKWIGLTGGIATGKSTAKKLIEGLGFPVIDADEISHQVSATGTPGFQQIVSHFGNEVLAADQSLDRKKLGAIIFTDALQRLALESILHPLIQTEVQSIKAKYQAAGQRVCFYDVPLLFEKNLASQFDSVVLIWCERNQQLNRLVTRNHLTIVEAELRMSAQMPLIDKVKRAHHCVDNSTDLNNLQTQIEHLLKTLV